MSTARPLLLVDVDGVLNPFAAPACPDGYAEHELFRGEEPVRVCAAHGTWLRELTAGFSLVWVSAWGEEANCRLAPLLDLPVLPIVPLPPVPFPPSAKLPAVMEFASDQPLAWLDDTLTPEAHAWAATRPVPTLLIDIDPAEGLTRSVVDQCLAFAAR